MKNISCFHTQRQVRDRSKLVTRRLRWINLKPGTLLQVVKKGMGLKPGQSIERMAIVKVVSVRRERLDAITAEDCALEGFPEMTPEDFVAFFCRSFKCQPGTIVTRIEWQYEPCPNDTNRDGDCGRRICPYCGKP